MQEIVINGDYHSHTTYSHGSGSVADNAREAMRKGLAVLAITDHGRRHPLIGVKPKRFDEIRQDIEQVKAQTGLEILMGIEANIIGVSGAIDLSAEDVSRLDIVLAGYHLTAYPQKFIDYFRLTLNGVTRYVFKATKAQKARNTAAFVKAIANNPIDILTHPGFRLDVDYGEIGKVCADCGTYVELSSRHRTPDDAGMEALLKTDCIFVVDSDAHKPENVGKWEYALDLLRRFDVPEARIANCGGKRLELRSKR